MQHNNLLAMIHDDITWCIESECPIVDCMRNTVNMIDRTGVHSYAMFKGTGECPIHEGCMEYCAYARKCFEENKDPDDALNDLQKYCDNCVFASMEED